MLDKMHVFPVSCFLIWTFPVKLLMCFVAGTMIGSPSANMHDVQNRIMSPVHGQGWEPGLFSNNNLVTEL